jgi:hypothetical protein
MISSGVEVIPCSHFAAFSLAFCFSRAYLGAFTA